MRVPQLNCGTAADNNVLAVCTPAKARVLVHFVVAVAAAVTGVVSIFGTVGVLKKGDKPATTTCSINIIIIIVIT